MGLLCPQLEITIRGTLKLLALERAGTFLIHHGRRPVGLARWAFPNWATTSGNCRLCPRQLLKQLFLLV